MSFGDGGTVTTDQKRNQIAHFVRSHYHPEAHPWPEITIPGIGPQPPTSEDIASEIVQTAEFKALQLATLLNAPDGRLIAEGVALVIPPYTQPAFQLWVGAMQRAAELQREGYQKTANRLEAARIGAS
jgi:hypothetical protein